MSARGKEEQKLKAPGYPVVVVRPKHPPHPRRRQVKVILSAWPWLVDSHVMKKLGTTEIVMAVAGEGEGLESEWVAKGKQTATEQSRCWRLRKALVVRTMRAP